MTYYKRGKTLFVLIVSVNKKTFIEAIFDKINLLYEYVDECPTKYEWDFWRVFSTSLLQPLKNVGEVKQWA